MNFAEVNSLMRIASAPVIDLDAPLPITVTAQQMRIQRWKHGRNWAVYDTNGELIAVTVYMKGAREIVRRLTAN